MAEITADLKVQELLQLAADNHHKRITLSEDERKHVIALLKQKVPKNWNMGRKSSSMQSA